MVGARRQALVPVATSAAVLALAGLLVAIARAKTGLFAYQLDDAYIHMTMARNVAEHGTWGMNAHIPDGASSSLLWPLVLAASVLVAGDHAVSSLLLNGVAAVAAIVALWRLLLRFGVEGRRRDAAVVVAALAAPLATMMTVGMEHALQVLITLVFAAAVALACRAEASTRRSVVWLGVAAGLATAIRYDGVLLVAGAGLVLLARRRWVAAFTVGAGAAIPLALYALWAWKNGQLLVPNPILLKAPDPVAGHGVLVHLLYLPVQAARALLGNPALLPLLAIAVAVRWTARAEMPPHRAALLETFVLAALLQATFARFGSSFRYEAHLMFLAIAVVAVASLHLRRPSWSASVGGRVALVAVALLLAAPVGFRAMQAYAGSPHQMEGTAQQQLQMAAFVHQFHDGEGVALNDIGAVAYASDIRLVDLWGLADRPLAEGRIDGTIGPDDYRDAVERGNASLAIVYRGWFDRYGGLPPEWQRVARWDYPAGFAFGREVSFYAFDDAGAARLREELAAFVPTCKTCPFEQHLD